MKTKQKMPSPQRAKPINHKKKRQKKKKATLKKPTLRTWYDDMYWFFQVGQQPNTVLAMVVWV